MTIPKTCNEPKIGALLPAYEILALSESDAAKFELHLMSCEFCRESIQELLPQTELLLHNEKLKSQICKTLDDNVSKANDKVTFWQFLWPNVPVFYRPAIPYSFLILILIASIVWFPTSQYDGEQVQQITLMSTRSINSPSFSKDYKPNGIISISYNISIPEELYTVLIINEHRDIILKEKVQFNKSGWAYLLLDLSKMNSGNYRLQLKQSENSSVEVLAEYFFAITP